MERTGESRTRLSAVGHRAARSGAGDLVGPHAAARLLSRPTLVLVVLATILAGARTARADASLESVIQKHLGWLQRTNNYLAEIRTSGLQTGRVGVVYVDNAVDPAQVFFEGEIEFPNKTKRTLEISGSDVDARATVDDRAAAWDVPKTPFNGSFSLFERGLTVAQATARVQQFSPTATVVENPQGGLVGIRMVPDPGFLSKVDGMLDSMLLGGSLPRDVPHTIWFNGDGRIERMDLGDVNGTPELVTKLIYLDVNLPAARSRKYQRPIRIQSKEQVYPSLLEMLLAIKQDDAKPK